MADRYWVAGGTGNYNSTTNWSATSGGASGASFPTAVDNVFFNASSGAGTATINVASNCLNLNLTGFTGTLAFTSSLTLNGTILNFGLGTYTVTGAGRLRLINTLTITSNGTNYIGNIDIGNTIAVTLADNLTCSGTFECSNGTTSTINGNTLNISGNLLFSGALNLTGTTAIVFNGTGTWSHTSSGQLRNNVTINTAGTLTLGTNVYYNTGTLTYTAGTVVTTGSTLTIGAITTLNTNGIVWNNVTAQGVVTLTSDLNIAGNLVLTSSINGAGRTAFVGGNFSGSTGTASIVLNGTGTWSGATTNNLTINTTGTITFSGTVTYSTGTLTYIAGTVVTTGSTLSIQSSCTLNTNGIVWNNVQTQSTTTLTLSSNFTLTGIIKVLNGILSFSLGVNSLVSANATLQLGNSSTFNLPANQTFKTLIVDTVQASINNNTLTLTENITLNGQSIGTSNIIYGGTGTWTCANSSSSINNNFTINTAGTLTISGTVYKQTGLFTYTAGTIIDTAGTLALGTSSGAITTVNISGFTFRKVLVDGKIILTSSINATTFGTWGGGTKTFTLGAFALNFTNLEIGGSGTTTLPTNWICQDITFVNTSSATLNTNQITINGNILQSGTSTSVGTTTFRYNGTGTWTATNLGYITNSFTINTLGTLTFISANIGGGIFTYTAGTVITTGSILYIRQFATTMNHGGIVWNNVMLGGNNILGQQGISSITLNNQLICLGTLTLNIGLTTFSGTNGTFDTYNLLLGMDTNALATTTLASTKTYRVRQSLICTQATDAFRVLIKSSVGASQAIFTLDAGATIDLGFVNATDINSSLGRRIYSYRGVFSNTSNWALLPTDVTPKISTFAN